MIVGLTLTQPLAWTVAHGGCNVLNRAAWPYPAHLDAGGHLLIHAGRGWNTYAAADPRVLAAADRVAGRPIRWNAYELAQLAGHVLAVARVVDQHRAGDCCDPWGEPPAPRLADRPGLSGHTHHVVIGDVVPLARPVRHDHGPGLWRAEPDLIAAVTAAQGAAA